MIYNLDKINEMAEGDDEFVVSVISVFLEEVPADLEELEAAIERSDYEQTYKLAHKIKPNVDLLGMETTRANALEIETIGKNSGSMNRIREIFPELKAAIHQVIQELTRDFDL
jgi:HPt (histidine-containing phosphotransfer) domain-containing protein